MSSSIITKASRFAFSGFLSTGIHVAIATLFIRLILPLPTVANAIAFIIATFFSYVINTLWSFSSPLHGRTLWRFLTVSGLGLLVTVFLSGLAQFYGLPYWVGIAFVVCCVPLITFCFHNLWTYR